MLPDPAFHSRPGRAMFLWVSSDKPPENFPQRQAAGSRRAKGVPLSQLALPCAFSKLPQIQSRCLWQTTTLISSGTPQNTELICASRLDFAENGRWHPPPSSVPRVWLVYVIPRQLAHTGPLWGHHRSCESCFVSPRVSGGVESALQYVLWCCGERSDTLYRMPLGTEASISKIQHPCIRLQSRICLKSEVPTTWTVCESCAVVRNFPAPKEDPKCAQWVTYPICKMEDTLLIDRPVMVWYFKLPWH